VVKFFSATDSLTVLGTLKAGASTGHKIVFTSRKEGVHRGDTNSDLLATVPLAKDWDEITLSASGSSPPAAGSTMAATTPPTLWVKSGNSLWQGSCATFNFTDTLDEFNPEGSLVVPPGRRRDQLFGSLTIPY
jgi:hypothetical protein